MNMNVNIMEIVFSLSGVIDLVCPQLNGHHARVAYIAGNIGEAVGIGMNTCENLFVAALLHDCGALSLKERLKALEFDTRLDRKHSEVGYRLLRPLKYFREAAGIIRHHHAWWNDPSAGGNACKEEIPEESYVLHLADRVDVLTDRNTDILEQAETIRLKIAKESGKMFKPQAVEVFLKLSEKDGFWKGISKASAESLTEVTLKKWKLEKREALEIASTVERIIDFRSRFTATHSRGVAAVAEKLAKCMGMEEDKAFEIRLAGSFHDLGKLGVPLELLEKEGRLTKEEYGLVRRHALLTYEVLHKIKSLQPISEYAAFHHERLDGTGYPFGLHADKLPAEARIVAVSDVFTAMTEERPYRKGISADEALNVLKGLAEKGKLDQAVVGTLQRNLDAFQKIRHYEQQLAVEEYKEFLSIYTR